MRLDRMEWESVERSVRGKEEDEGHVKKNGGEL